jgi:hypothetical protein
MAAAMEAALRLQPEQLVFLPVLPIHIAIQRWICMLTQKVHLAPNTQQAEQAVFTRAKSNDDVSVNFS